MHRYPETAKEALDMFIEGEVLWAIELGGFGPGYEQAIWDGIFQVIQAFHEEPREFWINEKEEKPRWADGLNDRLDEVLKDEGLSGAQFGAIKQTAWQMINTGWRKMMESAPEDRLIQISNVQRDALKGD